ncbi:HAD superfamily hydrolase (TIGR01549 family) [Labedella gwakjiensis]|uniref:HAD family hydrolase n=1 Tax=Labedella gwakjiensis TaxID=390269 RepID=A0A2P8GZC9_9MICO|nr:HAD family hydrolase [Labedella gwakjiensis]PSL39329.1 HAD superfamily hydrolase (TIGR01549 family) [Labedella gwakjiensis]RUQ86253.1 HAD family hydrolase [Labedella gwakjiensis]
MTGTGTPAAVLLDIDGTLVDSNYLHVDSWARTFGDLGVDVDTWRIHRGIGLDSTMLLDELLGDRVDELRDRATERHAVHYADSIERLRAIHGGRQLLDALTDAGLRVVLATSAPGDELEQLRRVLDVEDSLYAVTSSEDVETAKPEPDVIRSALDKAHVPADRAVMIGDARWDGIAAERAGVTFVGVLTGGISAAELREVGAVAVYDSVAEVIEHLDDAPFGELIATLG